MSLFVYLAIALLWAGLVAVIGAALVALVRWGRERKAPTRYR